jgi:hypothetical protein
MVTTGNGVLHAVGLARVLEEDAGAVAEVAAVIGPPDVDAAGGENEGVRAGDLEIVRDWLRLVALPEPDGVAWTRRADLVRRHEAFAQKMSTFISGR